MVKFVLISSLAVLCLSTFGEAARCDQNIIIMIKERFWNNGHCAPRELLRTVAYASPEIVKLTSENYYPNDDQISCIYSTIDDSTVNTFIHYINGGPITGPSSVYQFTEEDGLLIEEDKDILRYHLYANKFGVTAMYRCSLSGPLGFPEGVIKVTSHGYSGSQIEDSIEDLTSLGIQLRTRVFGDYCVP